MGSNQYWAGRVYDLCVYYMTGTPEGSTESGFMEKPGIEPATPGLQDIGLSPTPRWQKPITGLSNDLFISLINIDRYFIFICFIYLIKKIFIFVCLFTK